MRLPDVFTERDFPVAELCALRLDGSMFSRGDGFAVVDAVESAGLRALTLAAAVPAPRIVDRFSACWVWGVHDVLPRPIEVCVRRGVSQGVEPIRGISLRESTLAAEDVVDLAGVEVTSPRRTALDILRGSRYSPAIAGSVKGLLLLAGMEVEDVLRDLTDSRYQRERVRARERSLLLAA